MLVRAAPAGLAVLSVLLSAAGAGEVAVLVLLVAVPVSAVAGLLRVAETVDRGLSRAYCVPAAVSVLLIVAAAATRTPVLALGSPICLGIEHLRGFGLARPTVAESR